MDQIRVCLLKDVEVMRRWRNDNDEKYDRERDFQKCVDQNDDPSLNQADGFDIFKWRWVP